MTLTSDDLKAIGGLLAPMQKDINKIKQEQMRQDKPMRLLKNKVHRVLRLLAWFAKLENRRRMVALEKVSQQN